jgi:hypothetical protein
MRIMLSAAAFVALFVTSGCSDKLAVTSVLSSYTLLSLNGSALPITIEQVATSKQEISAGRITLRSDSTFEDRTTYRSIQGEVTSTQDVTLNGKFTRAGNSLTFLLVNDDDDPTNDAYFGQIVGDTLIATSGRYVWRYVK